MPNSQVDWDALLASRPDVLAEFQQESTRDHKSRQNLLNLGILDADDYAQWWATNFGIDTSPWEVQPTPVTPPPETTTPTYTPPVDPTPTDTGGVGAGSSTTPGGNRDTALNQALLNARYQLQSMGYDPNMFNGEIDSYFRDIYNIIPTAETNAQSYFDPNFVSSFITGKNLAASRQARTFVNNALRKPNLDYSSLDATISKLLEGGLKEGQDYLMRGKQRGQFNEVGYNAGLDKLTQAKTKATAKLRGYAGDIYNKYSSQFDDIYKRASDAASGVDFLSGFDITPYARDFDNLTKKISGEGLEGELLSLVGDEPLIDFASLRSSVGKGQGTVNLQDLDVLEGLERRRKADEAGRGLGSQGTF